jgi:hypothetical protein
MDFGVAALGFGPLRVLDAVQRRLDLGHGLAPLAALFVWNAIRVCQNPEVGPLKVRIGKALHRHVQGGVDAGVDGVFGALTAARSNVPPLPGWSAFFSSADWEGERLPGRLCPESRPALHAWLVAAWGIAGGGILLRGAEPKPRRTAGGMRREADAHAALEDAVKPAGMKWRPGSGGSGAGWAGMGAWTVWAAGGWRGSFRLKRMAG